MRTTTQTLAQTCTIGSFKTLVPAQYSGQITNVGVTLLALGGRWHDKGDTVKDTPGVLDCWTAAMASAFETMVISFTLVTNGASVKHAAAAPDSFSRPNSVGSSRYDMLYTKSPPTPSGISSASFALAKCATLLTYSACRQPGLSSTRLSAPLYWAAR